MLKFIKMQALGNDFMFIDARDKPLTLTAAQIHALADRHTGVGFDQLLCLEATPHPSVDGAYRIFNANGQEVTQCGNGARCVAQYLYQMGKPKTDAVVLASQSGLITITPDVNDNESEITLGEVGYYRAALAIPTFEMKQIPLKLSDKSPASYDAGWLTWSYLGTSYEGGVVNVGNPHWAIPVENFDSEALQHLGEALQVDGALTADEGIFPEGVNVSWLRVENRHQIQVETYERGVGLTRACGSAAAAVAVVAISQGWCDNPVRVNMPGGHLMVDWDGVGKFVFIAGPAVSVFKGELAEL